MTLLEILGENAPVERVVKFLKDVNIFYDIFLINFLALFTYE